MRGGFCLFFRVLLAEIACNVIFPLLGCTQRLHESLARRCENPKLQNGTRRVQCRGVSAVHSALQGSAENWRPNFRHFPTFSAPLVLQCLTSRM